MMADQRITELTPAPFVANDDLLAIVRDPNGVASTRRATFDQVATMLSNNPNLVIPDPVPAGTIFETLRDTPPAGWLFMDGQTLANAQSVYPALWAALPATFKSGTSIILPDLRGRVTLHAGTGAGLTNRVLGATGGAETHTLTTAQLPSHSHTATQASHSHTVNSHSHTINHGHGNNFGIGTTGSAHSHPVRYIAGAGTGPNPFGTGVVDPFGLNQTSNTVIPSSGTHTHNITGGVTSHSGSSGNTSPGTNAQTPAITVANTGSGNAHNNMQPFVVVNKMIKL
jgi:microcystin-dependent protein